VDGCSDQRAHTVFSRLSSCKSTNDPIDPPLPCRVLQVGTTVPCQQYLQSSWSVCSNSVVLGTGQGSVAVKLPKPSGVANFTANPRSITSSEDAARLNPLLVATSSRLSLAVAFNDGVVRDFSTDRRVVYGVAQGSMCEVVKGEHPVCLCCKPLESDGEVQRGNLVW
jgi:hypothetical protein